MEPWLIALATRRRVGRVVAPVLQVVASSPVPTYFPWVFDATFSFLRAPLLWGDAEVAILVQTFRNGFHHPFLDLWSGVQTIPAEFWEGMDHHEPGPSPGCAGSSCRPPSPYILPGTSSPMNRRWTGLEVQEFWPQHHRRESPPRWGVGMMQYIGRNLALGNVANAAWVSLLIGMVVPVYGLRFTRNLVDLVRRT